MIFYFWTYRLNKKKLTKKEKLKNKYEPFSMNQSIVYRKLMKMAKDITSSMIMCWGSQTGDERSISCLAMCVATACIFEFVTNGVVGKSLNWILKCEKEVEQM